MTSTTNRQQMHYSSQTNQVQILNKSLNTSTSSSLDQHIDQMIHNKGKPKLQWSQPTINVFNKIFMQMYRRHCMAYQQTYLAKHYACMEFQLRLKSITNDYQCNIFGSAAIGVSLPDSDIDIVLTSNKKQPQTNILKKLGQKFTKYNWIQSYNYVNTASIPVLKFNYQYLGQYIKFDITVNTLNNKNTGILSTQLMKNTFNTHPRLMQAFIILKYIIQRANLHNGYNGGISSYKLFIMIVCFVQEKKIDTNYFCLGQIIMKFLCFYAYDFDYKCNVLKLRKGQKCVIPFAEYYEKPNAEKLTSTGQVKMVDPVNDTLIRASFKKIEEVINLFKQLISVFEMMQEKCEKLNQQLKKSGNKNAIIEGELFGSYLARIFQSYLPYF